MGDSKYSFACFPIQFCFFILSYVISLKKKKQFLLEHRKPNGFLLQAEVPVLGGQKQRTVKGRELIEIN